MHTITFLFNVSAPHPFRLVSLRLVFLLFVPPLSRPVVAAPPPPDHSGRAGTPGEAPRAGRVLRGLRSGAHKVR